MFMDSRSRPGRHNDRPVFVGVKVNSARRHAGSGQFGLSSPVRWAKLPLPHTMRPTP